MAAEKGEVFPNTSTYMSLFISSRACMAQRVFLGDQIVQCNVKATVQLGHNVSDKAK